MRHYLMIIIYLIFFNSVLYGTHYYVSPTGNDSNLGTSESQAWRSLSKINSTTFKPGDFIKFKSGGIWNGSLKAIASGTEGNYITYTTYGGSERAKINVIGYGFDCNGYNYIRIENFEMSGGSVGIAYYHNANHGYIYNCYSHEASDHGIKFDSYQSPPYGSTQGSTVNSCIVENTWWGIDNYSVTGEDSPWSDFTITNCQVRNCTACGLKIMETVTDILGCTIKKCGNEVGYHCIYYGNPSQISGGSIKYCWLEDGFGCGLKISGGKTYLEGVTVAYNVFYQNGYYGIWAEWGIHDINIYNNVFYNNGYKGAGADFYVNYSRNYNLILENNIFYNNIAKTYIKVYPNSQEGFVSNNNCFYGNGNWYFNGDTYSTFISWKNGTNQDISSLNIDPRFVNAGSDFHLKDASSPCIDKGVQVGEINDKDGNLVPHGSAPDIGAYEFYSGNSSRDVVPPFATGHNPAKNAIAVPVNTEIVVHVKDDENGVDQSSLVMTVNGNQISPIITGTPVDFMLTYNPPVDFGYDQQIFVTIDAKDLANLPNVMKQDSYYFTTVAIDTVSPKISFVSADSATAVNVVFSESLEKTSAEKISNYSIDNGITVISATLDDDQKTVHLVTDCHLKGTNYTMTISNVKDRAPIPNIIKVNSSITYTYSSSVMIWIEAEYGVITSPMQVVTDLNVSKNSYIYVPNGSGNNKNGSAKYMIAIPHTDDYVIWGCVLAPNKDDDSFYVLMDSDRERIWDCLYNGQSNQWSWDQVAERGNGTFDNPQYDPAIFTLTEGEHTLVIKQLEDGTKLDRLLLTTDFNYIPPAPMINTISPSKPQNLRGEIIH